MSTETLHDCAACGRKNFSARGIKAHVCRPEKAQQFPMSKPEKQTSALTVLSAPELRAPAGTIDQLKEAAIGQIEAVARMEGQAAIGGILAGLTLHRVKASLKHGEFGPWTEKFTTGEHFKIRKTQVSYYMRLAVAFIEEAGADKDNLIALGDSGEMLDLADTAAGQALASKLKKFAGDNSLNELLIKHGIKGVGLKSSLATEKAEENPISPEASMQAAREMAWEQSYNAVRQIRAALSEPDQIQLLNDPKQIELLKAELVEVNKLADARLQALRTISI